MCEKRSARVENVQICAGGCLAGGGGSWKKQLCENIEKGGGVPKPEFKNGRRLGAIACQTGMSLFWVSLRSTVGKGLVLH